MALPMPIIILLLLPIAAKSEPRTFSVNRCLFFITELSTFHESSAVYFIYGNVSLSGPVSHYLLHSWSRALSNRGLMSSSISFGKLWNTEINRSRLFNPLFVVLLTDMRSLSEFSILTRHLDMSLGIWFVIFLWVREKGSGDYCHNPGGNIFSLTFTTELMVLCQNDVILREWYSVQENRTKINDVAIWSEKGKLVRLSMAKMHDKRNNLEGKVLRTVIVKESPVVHQKDGILHGFFGCLMNEISTRMNFTMNIVSEVIEYGTWNETTGKWNGAMAEIAEGRADIAISDFTMTSKRASFVDYTFPLMVGNDCLLIKKPSTIDIRWLGYFQTFSLELWISLVTLIIVAPIMLYFLRSKSDRKGAMPLILEEYTNVFGIFCQQGLPDYPGMLSRRMAYSSIFILAFVVYAAYSAGLVSFLTFHVCPLPFLSLAGFIDDGTYRLIACRGSADYEVLTQTSESYARRAQELLEPYDTLPTTVREAYQQVCKGNKVAFYASDVSRKINMTTPCKLACINFGRTDSIAIMLTKRNPLTALINEQLQKFMNSGVMDHLKGIKFSKIGNTEANKPSPIPLYSAAPVIAIFGIGIALSVLVLVAEKIYFKLSKGNQVADEGSVPVTE